MLKLIVLALIYMMAAASLALAAEDPSPRDFGAFTNMALQPFWRSTTMQGETLFFIKHGTGDLPSATLLFPPDNIVSVTSATGETHYELGRDFLVDIKTGLMQLPEGSRIPFKALTDLYPPAGAPGPKIANLAGDPNTFLLWSEGPFYHRLQVAVTYTHTAGQWKGYTPTFAGENLPLTMAKLRRKDPVTICLVGDSISQGYNASGFVKAPPFMPPYGELVADGLRKVYGSPITFKNSSVAGKSAGFAVEQASEIIAQKPDLVIIAFGMNDGAPAYDPEGGYRTAISAAMQAIRKGAPDVEFILVASMLGNPEWSNTPSAKFKAFQHVLTGLCGKGMVLADMTAMWTDLLKRKDYHDLTGNGVNHPNDFGHRLYAQVILSLLVEPVAKVAGQLHPVAFPPFDRRLLQYADHL